MNKFKTSTLLLSLISITFFSCSKEEKEPAPDPGPAPIVYGAINVYANKQLYGQETPSTSSFFATDSGKIYATTETSAGFLLQKRIDLVFFYRTANMASIGAPSDTATINAHTGFTSLVNWTNKNSTKFFRTSISVSAFDSVINDSLITSLDTLSITSGNVFNLNVDDVVAFRTAKGKYGLLRVKAINGNLPSNRSMVIDCKVQK